MSETKTEVKFQVGDVVRLKSAEYPHMTVNKVAEKGMVDCVFFSQVGELHNVRVASETLEKVK